MFNISIFQSFNISIFIEGWIANASVIDSFELLDEHSLGICDIAESDRTLAEESVGHHSVDKSIHHITYARLGILLERAGGGLNRVGHHQYGLFAGKGIRTWICEEQLIDIRIRMGVLVFDIEILCLALPVMSGDEIANNTWKIVSLGHLLTLGNMTDNHRRALYFGKIVVRTHSRLVFGEIHRIKHLADVVIQGASAHKLTLSTNLVGYLGSQVAHLNRVLECARSYLTHTSEQRIIGVRQFDKRYVGSETECLLDDIQQGIGKEEQHTIDHDIVVSAVVEFFQCREADEIVGEIHCCRHESDHKCRLEELGAVLQFTK